MFRLLWRLPACILVLIAGLCIQRAVFGSADIQTRRKWIRRWSGWILRAAGVRLEQLAKAGQGLEELDGARLLVANHVSWLDIMIINARAPTSFIAKAEIKEWPVLGWLVAKAGTLFIDRSKRSAIRGILTDIEVQFSAGHSVALFAEGTTNDMTELLPFHSNLMQPAINSNAKLVPIAIRYVDGDGRGIAKAVQFVGETTIVESVLRVLSARQIKAQLHVVDVIPAAQFANRQALALHLQGLVSDALGIPVRQPSSVSQD